MKNSSFRLYGLIGIVSLALMACKSGSMELQGSDTGDSATTDGSTHW